MSESGNIIAETAARIFADLADPQAVNSAADGGWKEPLWRTLAETGLTLAWVGEQHGGSGASLADGFDIGRVTGRFAARVPLAETLLAPGRMNFQYPRGYDRKEISGELPLV